MAAQPTTQVVHLPNFRPLPNQQVAQVFRSGALSDISSRAEHELAEYGIECVVDLREPYEIAAAPDHVGAHTYVNIPLYRGQVPLAAAIDDVYRILLLERGHQLAAAVQAIAQNLAHGVVVHCKAGKDRTGLVVALLMAVAGVPTETIITDYTKSAQNLSVAYRRQMTEQLESALADNPTGLEAAMHLHLASPEDALQRALELVDEQFGSARKYLVAHGVTEGLLTILTDHFAGGGHT